MIPTNEEVAVKQEILEISLSSLSDSTPTSNTGSSRKKRKHAGPEKRTAATKSAKTAPKTTPKLSISSFQPGALSNKLTVVQKDALRLAFAGHNSVPSLASRNAWASANNLKGGAVHRYCRYLRDRSKQNLIKQEPNSEDQVEAEWHLNVDDSTSVGERGRQAKQGEVPVPVPQAHLSKSHQPDFPAKSSPSMATRPHGVGASKPSSDAPSHPVTLHGAFKYLQIPDLSFLSDARFFNLLTGPEAITYTDLHNPITFCMKFQDSLCSLDMEVVHEALRTMYFFEGDVTGYIL